MVAGVPQRTALDVKKLWVVPIVLSKKAGGYGEIGTILIDDRIPEKQVKLLPDTS